MQVHLEYPFCPLCREEVPEAFWPRFDHWRQAHPEVSSLTRAQTSWILDRTSPLYEFEQAYPFDARSPNGTRYWRVETLERYLGIRLDRNW